MGRKRVPRYDVTKCFLLHKTLILNNLLNSLKHWNVKYAKVKYIGNAYIVSALIWL